MTRRKQKKEAKRITWNDDPEFERWIRFLFDRDDPKGAWRLEEPTPTLSDAQTVQYIHRLCATAEKELAPFSELRSPMGCNLYLTQLTSTLTRFETVGLSSK